MCLRDPAAAHDVFLVLVAEVRTSVSKETKNLVKRDVPRAHHVLFVLVAQYRTSVSKET